MKILPSQVFQRSADKVYSHRYTYALALLFRRLARLSTKSHPTPLTPQKSKTQITPQSSLGELGQSLLKFLTPIRRTKAHTKMHDYLDGAVKQSFAQNTQKAVALNAPEQALQANENKKNEPVKELKKGDEGSGYIVVNRDPRTPWLEMVTGIQEACTKKAHTTRSTLGSQVYGDASKNKSDLRRKTVGRIVNIMTEDDSISNEQEPGSKAKPIEHERKLLSKQYELDGKPKKKAA